MSQRHVPLEIDYAFLSRRLLLQSLFQSLNVISLRAETKRPLPSERPFNLNSNLNYGSNPSSVIAYAFVGTCVPCGKKMLNRYTGLTGLVTETEFVAHPESPY